ncbi:Putative 3-methyladenine DNA glycosylase [Galdieria sulphuraria]|nr:Putative 3-methyladenine DNA glycosylase [Galdieria sulphuraria]
MVYSLTENGTLTLRNTQSDGLEHSISPREATRLVVVGIQRYLQDSSFFENIGLLEQFPIEESTTERSSPTKKSSPSRSSSQYESLNNSISNIVQQQQQQQQIADWKTPAYDLLLSDGNYLLKCLLSPLLNGLVQYGWLTISTCIKLEKYEWRRNEGRIPIATFLVVHQLSVLQMGPVLERNRLIFPDNADPCETRPQPLAGRRLHYLSLNTEDCVPVDPHIHREDIIIDSFQLFGDSQPQLLSKVVSFHENRKITTALPLIGRVVKKFSCSHFGRRESEQKFPIKFELQIADHHMVAQVICWYTLYFRYFESIQLDDIIILEGYRIRQKDNNTEILLNPSNPQGKMFILDYRQAMSRNLRQSCPPIRLNLMKWSTLRNQAARESFCDFVGRIHRLFPIQRYRPTHEYRFYERRWVLIRDSSSPFDIPILMYSCSQPKCFYSLQVGRPLLVTDCRLCRVDENMEQNSFYLKTTFSSQFIYLDEQWQIMRWNHPEISFEELFGEDSDDLEQKDCLSTYTRIRNHPDWLESLPSRLNDSLMEYLITFGELENRAKLLHLGESRTFLCQGRVKKVKWRYKKGYELLQVWECPSYLPKFPQVEQYLISSRQDGSEKEQKQASTRCCTQQHLEYLLDLSSCDEQQTITVLCTKREVCRPYRDKKTVLRKASSCSRILLEAFDDTFLSRISSLLSPLESWDTPAQVAEQMSKYLTSETMVFEIEAMRWHPSTSIPPCTLSGVVSTLIGAYCIQ